MSKEQEEHLEEFKRIRRKKDYRTDFKTKFCESQGYEEALETLKETVPDEERTVRKTFESLKPLHDEVIGEKKEQLVEKKEELEEKWLSLEKAPLKEIEKTFDSRWKADKIKIYLYYTGSSTSVEGEATLDSDEITLGISPERSAKRILDIAVHELCHLIQRNRSRNIESILTNKYNFPEKQVGATEEAIMRSLAYKGLLSKDLLELKIKKEKPSLKSQKNPGWSTIAINAYQKMVFPIIEDYYYHRDERNFWEDCLPKIVDKVTDLETER